MTTIERSFGALLILLAAPSVWAGEEDLERLVREQGAQIKRLETEVKDLRNSRSGGLEDDVAAYLETTSDGRADAAAPTDRIHLGGYFSIEFRDNGDNSNMQFDAHRLVFKVNGEVAEGITFDTEVEIEGGGADVSFLTGNEILVEYAEVGFQLIDDKLIFVAGIVLMPWGRFNQVHDDPLNDLTDRPLVSRYVGAVAFGQPGIAVEGTLELVNGWFFDYDIALVQGFSESFTTNGGARTARQSFRADNNNNKQVFGRFVVSPPTSWLDVLDVGASFTVGKWDNAGDLADYGYGVDLFLKKGPFELTGEYMMLRIEQAATAPLSDPRRMDGWYVQIAYHFFPAGWRGKHVLFTDESTFTLVVRVEGVDLNHSTRGTAFRDDLDQVIIGFNFRPVERTVLKVSYTFVNSADPAFGGSSADVFALSWATYF